VLIPRRQSPVLIAGAILAALLLTACPGGETRLPPTAGTASPGRLTLVVQASPPAGHALSSDEMAGINQMLGCRLKELTNGGYLEQYELKTLGADKAEVAVSRVSKPDVIVETLQATGLLEFVDAGTVPLEEGARIPADETRFQTILANKHIKAAQPGTDESGQAQVEIELTPEGAGILADYTRTHVGDILAILLDRVVLSAPKIQVPITGARVRITGASGFTVDRSYGIASQARCGPLPVPVRVVENTLVSASGQ
jgi:preprotein translocase subunit SecD